MNKFKKGDRVRFRLFGEGFVLEDYVAGNSVPVQFDKASSPLHSCDGLGENGRCWYCIEYQLELIKGNVIERTVKVPFGEESSGYVYYNTEQKYSFGIYSDDDPETLSMADIDDLISALHTLKVEVKKIKSDL